MPQGRFASASREVQFICLWDFERTRTDQDGLKRASTHPFETQKRRVLGMRHAIMLSVAESCNYVETDLPMG